jgi:hypothetical protein
MEGTSLEPIIKLPALYRDPSECRSWVQHLDDGLDVPSGFRAPARFSRTLPPSSVCGRSKVWMAGRA